MDIPFGWKDPKNTFTLDFWKHVFPHPRIIHIYRNPIDSVSSYIERDLALKNKFEWNWKKKLKRDWLISKNFHENFRLYNLNEGYDLWEEYVSKALSLKHEFEHYTEVRYEDFLEQPKEMLKALALFSGLNPSAAQLDAAIEGVQQDRAFAFIHNEAYFQVYQQLKNNALMQQLGYDHL